MKLLLTFLELSNKINIFPDGGESWLDRAKIGRHRCLIEAEKFSEFPELGRTHGHRITEDGPNHGLGTGWRCE